MARTPRIYLPADVKFSDITGLVWGTGHCAVKDVKYGRDNKTMTSIKDFAQFGEYEWRTGRKKTLELSLEGPSEEVEALLTGSDLVTGVSDEGYFGEVVGIAVAGVFPALTNIPVLEGSEVVRKCSDAQGHVITERLQFSTVAPVVTTYNIVNATGVITTDAAYILYATVNYAKHDAAAGTTMVEDDSADIPLMDVTIIARAADPEVGTKGSAVFVFPNCEVIKEPDDAISMESANVATVRFNVAGAMRKSIHLA